MKRLYSLLTITSIVVLALPANAQFLTAVKPLPGYVCGRLNMPPDQVINPSFNVPVFSGPSDSSSKVGQASAALIVKSPLHVQNGFAEILLLDGRPGWLPANLIGPYATAAIPNARCTPSLMSNGRPGFG